MSGKKVLLVEGMDDEHVLKHICGNRGLGSLDEIAPQKSVEQLLENFPVRLKESDVDRLGLVLDADTDIHGRWHAVRNRLSRAGYVEIPETPCIGGTILTPPPNTLLPRFGVWLMPNNTTPGILEDFLAFLIPEGSFLLQHVKSSVAAIPEAERRFARLVEPKVIIHTWLAWQEEPGKPLGTAITARFLDPNVQQVDVLVKWLRALYFS